MSESPIKLTAGNRDLRRSCEVFPAFSIEMAKEETALGLNALTA